LEGFLNDYRITVNGFPVVQAVILPLGLIVSCIAMTLCAGLTEKNIEYHNPEDEGGKRNNEVAPPYEYYPNTKA
jgi:hypothetical protein